MLTKQLAEHRKNGADHIYPDGKAQVLIEYVDGKPSYIKSVLISTQHDLNHATPAGQNFLLEDVLQNVIIPTVMKYNEENPSNPLKVSGDTEILVNPTGNFYIGSSRGDAGLTGRKIIVDTYGGMARHGGGNFQGKDPSKVDRSAAYAMRWVAKTIVAAQLAERVELQVSYAIGQAEPVGLYIDTFGTGKASDEAILKAVKQTFDLRPQAIIDNLKLKDITNYQKVAAYGHFGENAQTFSWEQTNKALTLIKNLTAKETEND